MSRAQFRSGRRERGCLSTGHNPKPEPRKSSQTFAKKFLIVRLKKHC